MTIPAAFSVKSVLAMLCIVLSLAFVGSSAVDAVNALEHQRPQILHEHPGLGEMAFGDHQMAAEADGGPQSAPGHHHHGDMAGVMLVSIADLPAGRAPVRLQQRAGSDDLVAAAGPSGLERPPKPLAISA